MAQAKQRNDGDGLLPKDWDGKDQDHLKTVANMSFFF